MRKIDVSALDGRALQVFLTVLAEGSVTAAADRLGITQSAVSHTLVKLRRILRDPLFVKSGRGIVATRHAQALAGRARTLLDDMKALAAAARFEPGRAAQTFTIAANDFQRDLLLPALLRRTTRQAPGIALRIIPSGVPSAELLRADRCDLIVTPLPPAGADILRQQLLVDRWACFYDPAVRRAPRSLAEFARARHVTVVFDPHERLEFDKALQANGLQRTVVVELPNFSGVEAFLRGTPLLATVPSLLRRNQLRELACDASLFATGALARAAELRMYAAWHQRTRDDPAHAWLRAQLAAVAEELAGA